jgi:NSS family neurotransmitter:Na+ symporter
VVASVIDQLRWSRRRAALVMGSLIFLFGVPSALAGSGSVFANWKLLFGKDFFDTMDYLGSNWLLPLGGLFIAIFVGWVMPEQDRAAEFRSGSKFGYLYASWKWILRLVVPAAILILWLFSVEILPKSWLSPGL